MVRPVYILIIIWKGTARRTFRCCMATWWRSGNCAPAPPAESPLIKKETRLVDRCGGEVTILVGVLIHRLSLNPLTAVVPCGNRNKQSDSNAEQLIHEQFLYLPGVHRYFTLFISSILFWLCIHIFFSLRLY